MKAQEISQMNMDRLPLGKVAPLRTPLVVYVETSRVCNFKCEFCFKAYGGGGAGKLYTFRAPREKIGG